MIKRLSFALLIPAVSIGIFAWHANPFALGEVPVNTPDPKADTVPREKWIPAAAGAVLDIARPTDILDTLLAPVVLEHIAASPGWQSHTKTAQAKKQRMLVGYIENRFDCTWQDLLRKLTRKGLTIGVGEGGVSALIMDAESAAVLQKAHEVLLAGARSGAKRRGAPGNVQDFTYRGVSFWTTSDGKAYHAVLGNRLVVSNNLQVLKHILDMRSGDDLKSIADVPEYAAAKHAAAAGGGENTATLLLSPAALEAMRQKNAKPAQEPNPLAALLLAGYGEALQQNAGWLGLGFDAGDGSLALRIAADAPGSGTDAATTAFANPDKPNEGALPVLEVPRQVAGMSLYRDLRQFYAAKDDLFPERTSGLIFFENMMGIFFSGLDLTDEVMGELDPHLRMVVAEQAYDRKKGVPEVEIPAFALVVKMKNPEEFALIAEEAWQKALGMVNFTRGQKAQRGLIIDRLIHDDIKFTSAAFSTAGEKNKKRLDARFNFSPSIAYCGEHLILSSEEHLTRDVIDALKAEKNNARSLAGTNGILKLDGPSLASVVENNREHFIRQSMLKKGHDRARAEREFPILPMILNALGAGSLELGGEDGSLAVELRFDLNIQQGQGETAAAGND